MELDRYQRKKSRPEVKELKVNRRAVKKKSPTRETGEDGESESDTGTRRRTPEPPELGEEKAGLVTTKSSQVTKRNFPPEEAAGSGAHRRDRGSPELTPSQEEDKEPEMEEVTEETAECHIMLQQMDTTRLRHVLRTV